MGELGKFGPEERVVAVVGVAGEHLVAGDDEGVIAALEGRLVLIDLAFFLFF